MVKMAATTKSRWLCQDDASNDNYRRLHAIETAADGLVGWQWMVVIRQVANSGTKVRMSRGEWWWEMGNEWRMLESGDNGSNKQRWQEQQAVEDE